MNRIPLPFYTGKKFSRNAACPCGSGLKYKHCCLARHRQEVQTYESGLQMAILEQQQRAMAIAGVAFCRDSATPAARQPITRSNP
jgi:uncharacterized protein YchJ